jgi:hypothetical protein
MYGDQATDWTTGERRFESRHGQEFCLFFRNLTQSETPTAASPVGTVALIQQVKQLKREADSSSQYNAEVKNEWSYNFTPKCRHDFHMTSNTSVYKSTVRTSQ